MSSGVIRQPVPTTTKPAFGPPGQQEPPIDPLRRVFVPRESKQGVFQTLDRELYVRDQTTGVIRHARVRMRGKAARKAERAARKVARGDR